MNFPQMEAVLASSFRNEEQRKLLDKAIIGMGAMVDLIERHRTDPLASYDPEAGAAEALDMIKITESAATAERTRIVALIRQQANAPALDVVTEVLDRLADALETGRLR